MLVEMRRVDVVMPRVRVGEALRVVHRTGLVHLVPFVSPPRVGPAAFTRRASVADTTRYASAVERVGELARVLAADTVPDRLLTELWDLSDELLLARVDALAPVARAVDNLEGERLRLGTELGRLRGYRLIVEGHRGVVGRLPVVQGYAATGIVVGAQFRGVVTLLSNELEAVTDGRCEVVSGDLGPDRVAAILLYLAGLRLVLADRQAEAEALAEAGASDHLVVLSGWVPADRLAELRAALDQVAGSDVMVVERDIGERPADAPVAMANAGFVRPYEPLASFVAVPRYGTLDPTPALAITLPAFIGLMVADTGYGLVLLVALLVGRHRWGDRPWMRALWPIGVAVAVSTIAFGILFGELFGMAGRQLVGMQPILFDRREGVV
jgi:hypothetical protein